MVMKIVLQSQFDTQKLPKTAPFIEIARHSSPKIFNPTYFTPPLKDAI